MVPQEFLATLRRTLLDRRVPAGHWEGHLSASALATATAVAAFAAARRAGVTDASDDARIRDGLRWLVAGENADGGWGDTPDSPSNISTTALVWSALAFGQSAETASAAARAEGWIARAAGSSTPDRLASALAERYGRDRTFSVPILTMCAIAGRLGPDEQAWRLIPPLPFELSVLPQRFFGALRLPVVSYALPALISMGLARHRRGPGHFVAKSLRARTAGRAMGVLQSLQPRGGGFLEAIPLTSFVAMSLVAAGEHRSVVVERGLEFLRRSARPDGSWAIDSNLATWVTTLAINALAAGDGLTTLARDERDRVRVWLLAQQWRVEHPYTGAAPGGWAWTDLPGGVPDADDTAGALVALGNLDADREDVRTAAALGVQWLLDLQNRDGGIPTFCRGWGTLPFDRSSTDLTAHALRAWLAWQRRLDRKIAAEIDCAVERAVHYLRRSQRADGAFVPLWFGNQAESCEENPLVGTGRVLAGLGPAAAAGILAAGPIAMRAAAWVLAAQNDDGGWGAGHGVRSSLEETAIAIGGIVAALEQVPDRQASRSAIRRGLDWIVGATGGGIRFRAAPIGLYFARLWYSEELYPLIFSVGAVEAARLRAQG